MSKNINKREELINDAAGIITKISQIKELDKTGIPDELKVCLERLEDKNYRIAIAGEFSSGKSTFLNALIGADVLKHGRAETTAAITEIENSSDNISKSIMDIYFNDGSVKAGIPIENIAQYTTVSAPNVKEKVEKVVIKSCIFKMSQPILFVDTPGLNGMEENLPQKTFAQIARAHACIYILSSSGLSGSDERNLHNIAKYQKNFLVVQNFIDDMKESEGESPEKKIAEQAELLNKVFEGYDDINYKVVGFSALKALDSADSNITVSDIDNTAMTDEKRRQYRKDSLYDEMIESIKDMCINNRDKATQYKDTISYALNSYIYPLYSVFENVGEADTVNMSRDKKHLISMKTKLEENKAENLKKIKNFVTTSSIETKHNINDFIKKDTAEKRDSLTDHIRSIKSIEEFEEEYTSMPTKVGKYVSEIRRDCEAELGKLLGNTQHMLLERVNSYTGLLPDNVDKGFTNVNLAPDSSDDNFKNADNEITKLETEIKKLGIQIEQSKTENVKDKQKIERLKEQKKKKEREKSELKSKMKLKIGEAPAPQKKSRPVTKYVERGGWGIMDALFGPKPVQTIEYYDDYTAYNEWVENSNIIAAEYREKESAFGKEINSLQKQITYLENSISDNKERIESDSRDLLNQQRFLKAKKATLEASKTKAKAAYLNRQKTILCDEIDLYFDNSESENGTAEGICQKIMKRCENLIESSRIDLLKQGEDMCNFAYKIQLTKLEELINEKTSVTNNQNNMELLKNAIDGLEEIVCQI